jgi:hypothetical protein
MDYKNQDHPLFSIQNIHYHFIYEGYSESYLHLFFTTNVGMGESSRTRGNVTWPIAV